MGSYRVPLWEESVLWVSLLSLLSQVGFRRVPHLEQSSLIRTGLFIAAIYSIILIALLVTSALGTSGVFVLYDAVRPTSAYLVFPCHHYAKH